MTNTATEAFDALKVKLTTAPVLAWLDYDKAVLICPGQHESDSGLVILGVDSSWMGARWAIYQMYGEEKKITLFGSTTFN